VNELNAENICEYLCFNYNEDFSHIKFLKADYYKSENRLELTFNYSPIIEDKIASLREVLENEYKKLLNFNVALNFIYRKVYLDEQVLSLKVLNFLKENYRIQCAALTTADVKVSRKGEEFIVNLFLPESFIAHLEKSPAFNAFKEGLTAEYFEGFAFYFNGAKEDFEKEDREFEEYIASQKVVIETAVNKVFKIKNVEYAFGKPIKDQRPIKIEFLRVSSDDQVIAGRISFLQKREYKKDDETKFFYSFLLNDGAHKASAVIFPTEKNKAKLETLKNDDIVVIVGQNTERNGRTGFRVSGLSFCEFD
jgi:hypothetical protein